MRSHLLERGAQTVTHGHSLSMCSQTQSRECGLSCGFSKRYTLGKTNSVAMIASPSAAPSAPARVRGRPSSSERFGSCVSQCPVASSWLWFSSVSSSSTLVFAATDLFFFCWSFGADMDTYCTHGSVGPCGVDRPPGPTTERDHSGPRRRRRTTKTVGHVSTGHRVAGRAMGQRLPLPFGASAPTHLSICNTLTTTTTHHYY